MTGGAGSHTVARLSSLRDNTPSPLVLCRAAMDANIPCVDWWVVRRASMPPTPVAPWTWPSAERWRCGVARSERVDGLEWSPGPHTAASLHDQLAAWLEVVAQTHPYWIEEARLRAADDVAVTEALVHLCTEAGLEVRLATDADGAIWIAAETPALGRSCERWMADASVDAWWFAVLDGIGTVETWRSRDTHGISSERPPTLSVSSDGIDVLERDAGTAVEVAFGLDAHGVARVIDVQPMSLSAMVRVGVLCDLEARGRIDVVALLCAVQPSDVTAWMHPGLSDPSSLPVLTTGLPAGPGACAGAIALDLASVRQIHRSGQHAVYFSEEPGPDDIAAIVEAQAVVTARGGRTSHAAVLAQQLGRPCVVGCADLAVDHAARTVVVRGQRWASGTLVTVDGTQGRVHAGLGQIEAPRPCSALQRVLQLADSHRRLRVRANADRASEAKLAFEWGAEGIGLVRTEHMFLGTELVHEMRALVLSTGAGSRDRALEQIRPAQAEVIGAMFAVAGSRPITVRLLDPPLHEFLPANPDDMIAVARRLDLTLDRVRRQVSYLRESNPMLGRRGVRIGITAPAIYDAQIEGVLDAIEHGIAAGHAPCCELMVPFVVGPSEMHHFRARIEALLAPRPAAVRAALRIGAMIELPRACLLAGEIARQADFLSFGTNDLTQTVFGFSRDDTAGFLPAYLAKELLPSDPFQVLDRDGVGAMIELACVRARSANPSITIGLCGEHAAHASALEWIHTQPIDYVSCSPWRVPSVRIAAARAALGCGE
jgi:pyruvate,orthophosphate dikinase